MCSRSRMGSGHAAPKPRTSLEDMQSLPAPAVREVGATRAFTRDHRRSKRTFGRAVGAERRTVAGFLASLQHEPADAAFGLGRLDGLDVEQRLRVEVPELRADAVTRFRDAAD